MGSVRKTMREIERQLPLGYTVRLFSSGKHAHVVVDPDGSPLRDENGKIIPVATTPSDRRHLLNLLGRVRRAIEGGQHGAAKK